jgi:hypothetical protein
VKISLTTTELRRASNTLTGDKIKIWKSDEEDAPPFGLWTAVSHLRYTIYCTSFCTFLFGFRSPASSRMMNERIDSNGDGEEEKKKKESSHQCDTIIASLDVSMGTRYTRTGLFVSCCPFASRKDRNRVAATNQTKQNRRNIRGRNDKETKKKKKIGDIYAKSGRVRVREKETTRRGVLCCSCLRWLIVESLN